MSPLLVTEYKPTQEGIYTVRRVAEVHSKYWKSLPQVVDLKHYYREGEADEKDQEALVNGNGSSSGTNGHIVSPSAAKPIAAYMQNLGSLLDKWTWELMTECRMYKFPLKLDNSPITIYQSSQALKSSTPLLLLLHGSGYIRFTNQTSSNLLNTNSALLTGTMMPYVDTALRSGMNVIAFHVLSASQPSGASASVDAAYNDDVKRVMHYIWDEYVGPSEASKIYAIADPTGARCLTPLITGRDVESRIAGSVVFTLPNQKSVIPPARKSPMLKDKATWFSQTSKVLMPSDETELGATIKTQRRFGHCVSSGPTSGAHESLWTFREEAFAFLKDRNILPPAPRRVATPVSTAAVAAVDDDDGDATYQDPAGALASSEGDEDKMDVATTTATDAEASEAAAAAVAASSSSSDETTAKEVETGASSAAARAATSTEAESTDAPSAATEDSDPMDL